MTENFDIKNLYLEIKNTEFFDNIYNAFRRSLSELEINFMEHYLPGQLTWEHFQSNPEHGVYLNHFRVHFSTKYSWIRGALDQHDIYMTEDIIRNYLCIHFINPFPRIPHYVENELSYFLLLEYYEGGESLPDCNIKRNTLQITLAVPDEHYEFIKKSVSSKCYLE